ncbi:polysaccharide lyase [Saccharopolyspora hordei]|uniref:polysaccharide lyase n=1 Tax=Saccharopolyspora hordei TaxID=1838 RepID=UPI0035E49EB5
MRGLPERGRRPVLHRLPLDRPRRPRRRAGAAPEPPGPVPTDRDFGRGGKLPGLYGGPPGQASGGEHGQAWSTRCMWRVRDREPQATVFDG